MTMQCPSKSFTDPDTEFKIIRSKTPVDVDGFKLGEPTGEIECCACGRSADVVEEIPHTPECSQRFVISRFWAERALK